ncbi:PEP/pyruvate-binding domain-containing protein [Saccharopolyspora shandongensis]|uniref:PEP/pyruvate-binding domain-containing protein n=1 Tax=Saccharopolyspora shandongensis TaxID=418495 RepID=UPI0034199D05
MPSIRWFSQLGLADVPFAGGKGANLGELTQGGFPVPPGFVISAGAYRASLREAGVEAELNQVLAESTELVDDQTRLTSACTQLRQLVHQAGMSAGVRGELDKAYSELDHGLRVAVRSSATAEDAPGISFAGVNESFTNVTGSDELATRVVDCWASLFSPRRRRGERHRDRRQHQRGSRARPR